VVAGARDTKSLEGRDCATPAVSDLAMPATPAALVQRAIDEHHRIDVLATTDGPIVNGESVNAFFQTAGDATGVDADTASERIIVGIGGFATGRFTTPEEVATLVVLLASERTGNVTAANDLIDGGPTRTT